MTQVYINFARDRDIGHDHSLKIFPLYFTSSVPLGIEPRNMYQNFQINCVLPNLGGMCSTEFNIPPKNYSISRELIMSVNKYKNAKMSLETCFNKRSNQ